jgi:hypothetical protein
MRVEFVRTRPRAYAVRIHRDGDSPLEMNPAPGYDDLMPHDLLHLVVEDALGLRGGIFGQVAAGGHAGTFHTRIGDTRAAARRRRRATRQGDRLRAEGRDEAALSERATYLCLQAWLARARDAELRRQAAQMAAEADHIRATRPRAEAYLLDDAVMARILGRMDALSARWRALAIGESLTVEWPDSRS